MRVSVRLEEDLTDKFVSIGAAVAATVSDDGAVVAATASDDGAVVAASDGRAAISAASS